MTIEDEDVEITQEDIDEIRALADMVEAEIKNGNGDEPPSGKGFNPFTQSFERPPTHTVRITYDSGLGTTTTTEFETWFEGIIWGMAADPMAFNAHDETLLANAKIILIPQDKIRRVEIWQHTLLSANDYVFVPPGQTPTGPDGRQASAYL